MSTERRDVRAISSLVGDLHAVSESARSCGLTFDEVVTLLRIQFQNTGGGRLLVRSSLDEG